MEFSASILLYILYAALGALLLFALFNIFHLFRFGLIDFTGLFVTLAYVALTGILAAQLMDLLRAYDWSGVLTIPLTIQ